MAERLAFLVTDIEGSTARWDRYPEDMPAALAAHDRILNEAVAESGGTVFKHTGDGILAAFPDSFAAVRAAEVAQHGLADHEWGEVGELRVRMGVDAGEAEARDGDFYGPPLNRSARLMAAGHGGQVLVSEGVQAELLQDLPSGIQLRTLGEHWLRGFAIAERIFQVVFVGLPAEFPVLRLDASSEFDETGMGLSLPGYRVRDRVGEGAYGMVYRAYQPSVGREVAVKVIRPDLASHPSFVRRFEAEARTIARLAHPRIVPLHDFWRDSDGAYLVMQLLPGGNLAHALAVGTMDPASGVRYVRHVAEALAHAHDRGVVHGDLKPANVLLDGAGNAYLSDFGIAARLLDPAEIGMRTSSAPAYRAPEEAAAGPTQRGDLYALGMLTFETLTGQTPAVMAALPPVAAFAPELPSELDDVLARATAEDPADRHQSVAAFLAEFDAAVADLAVVAPVAPTTIRNPYKGLRAFDETDAGDFFGRDELVASLVTAVERLRFVTVTGPSGCGKSSAVKAGLLPAIRSGAIEGSENWYTASFSPGPQPALAMIEALEGLATSPIDLPDLIEGGDLAGAAERLLGDSEGELLVVVDQFEEIFTLVESPDRRQEFIDLLVAAATDEGSRVRIVATLRADFYDRPLAVEHLDRLVRDGLVTVLRPSRNELIDMITKPAVAVGLGWEPGLPPRIAEDVHRQSGGLPLLQYALTELVERRSGELLTGDGYDRLGGVTGALAARAEAVCTAMTPAQQSAARQILLRLVTVGEESDDTRRRVLRSELEDLDLNPDDLDAVLDALISRRLLTTDRDPVTRGPTVEVAHEALLEQWPRLRGWIDGQREALILGRRLRVAMADWDDAGHNDDYLLTGDRLAPFKGWEASATLTIDERAYLDLSIGRDETERLARARRRRILTGVLVGATLVAVVLAGLAMMQWIRADRQADQATAAERLAEERLAQAEVAKAAAAEAAVQADEERAAADAAAEEADRQRVIADEQAELARKAARSVQMLASEARAFQATVVEDEPELAVLLALEAIETMPDNELVPTAVEALHSTVLASPVRGRVEADIVAGDAAGRYLVTGFVDRLDPTFPTLWDRITGDTVQLPVPDSWVGAGTNTEGGAWSSRGGDGVTAMAISRDGSLVAVGLGNGGVVVFDTVTLAERFTTNDRQLVWTTATNGELRLGFGDAVTAALPFDASAQVVEEALEELVPIGNAVVAGTGSEEDPWVIEIREHSADYTHTLVVDGPGVAQGRGHPGNQVRYLVFQPDGTRLASAALDGTRIWDLSSTDELRLTGLPLAGMTFSSDGTMLAGGWPDSLGAGRGQSTAVIWDAATGGELHRFPSVERDVTGVAFNPSGDSLAVSYADGEVGLGVWDLGDGTETIIPDTTWNGAVAVNLDGSLIVAGGDVFRIDDSGVELERQLTSTGVIGLAFDDSGTLIGNLDSGEAMLWDLGAAGASEWLTVETGAQAEVSCAVSHSGLWLAGGSGDRFTIMDAASGDELLVLRPSAVLIARFGLPTDPDDYLVMDAEFSPDDSLLVTALNHGADRGGAVMVWDTASGRLVTVLGDPTAATRGGWSATFSPDGSALAASINLGITVWETSGFREIYDVPATAALWWPSAAFSPDGALLAVRAEGIDAYLAAFGNRVLVFELDGGQILRCCDHNPPRAGASVVSFSPDGSMLLTNGSLSGGASDVRLWDVESGNRLQILGPVDEVLQTAAFSPDGSIVAAADGADIQVFDVATGASLGTVAAVDEEAAVGDIGFSPDGTRLAAAIGDEGVVRVFALELGELTRIATTRLTRSFTDTECQIYNIDPCPTLEEVRARSR